MYQMAGHHISDDFGLHDHRFENIKSNLFFLGTFACSRKEPTTSSSLSVGQYQLGSHWTYLRENGYWELHKNLSRNQKFDEDWTKMSVTFYVDLSALYFCRRRKISVSGGVVSDG
jgi:hypothetical protein